MKCSNLSLMLGRLAKDVLTGCVPAVLFTVILAVSLMSATADAAIYYVSPTGSDVSGDGSESTPWRTICHAVSQTDSGDTIKVMDDDDEATDDYTGNITVDKRLTIERYNDTGANPQVAASDTSNHVFYVTADSVTISGLDIYGATEPERAGIYLDNLAVYCAIQNNHCGGDRDSLSASRGESCPAGGLQPYGTGCEDIGR